LKCVSGKCEECDFGFIAQKVVQNFSRLRILKVNKDFEKNNLVKTRKIKHKHKFKKIKRRTKSKIR